MPKTNEPRNGIRLKRTDDGFDLRLSGVVGDGWEGFTDDWLDGSLDDVEGRGLVRINSPGGMVFQGIAIYSMLARRSDLTVRVEGLAASIASVIMLAGQRVEIERGAMVMIHNPWNVVMGESSDLRKSADVLDKIKESIIDIYEAKTGQPRDVLAEMMDEETWMTADEAVEWGFADAVVSAGDTEPEDLMQQVDLSILANAQHAPARIAALIKNSASRRSTRATEPENTLSNGEPTMTDTTNTPAAPQNAPEPDPNIAAKASAKAAAEAVAAERNRVSRIKALCAEEKIADSFRDRLIDEGIELAEAEARITMMADYLAKASATDGIQGPHRVVITRDERDTVRTAVATALLHRARPGEHEIAGDDPAREYTNMSLMEMARNFAENAGKNTRNMTRAEIAQAALHSTSDFPLILENVVGKSLRAGYDLAPRVFPLVGNRETLPDFKDVSRVHLGAAPSLQKIQEGGEYTYGELNEEGEKYRVFKYGKTLALTWEALINDDLSAFTRVPLRLGEAAAQLESAVFWAELTGNANMADGNALFSVAHGNLAGSGAAISVSSLGLGRTAMRQQKDGDHYLAVQPAFLVVPTEKETIAEQFVSQNLLPDSSGSINPFAGRLQVISEPRLDENSATAWYLFASPNSIDTIAYAYLQGEEGPQITTHEGFDVDGMKVKVRHCFGAKAIDWRGMYKNPGA